MSLLTSGGNLANLIRDIRLDLDAPNLPFIIGELGMHGMDISHLEGKSPYPKMRVATMRAAQQGVTLTEEFKNSTLYVRTAPYAVHNVDYQGSYHYYGDATTYLHIGEAFGNGMLELIDG